MNLHFFISIPEVHFPEILRQFYIKYEGYEKEKHAPTHGCPKPILTKVESI